MKTDSVARRMSALTVVVTLFASGMPCPVGAADEEVVPVARHGGLTINGRPLSQVVAAKAGVSGRVPLLPGLLEQGSGQISGVALDTDGQPLKIVVELLRVSEQGRPVAVVDTTTTSENGGFSYSDIAPGRYMVRAVIDAQVGAASGVVSLAQNGMTFLQLGGPARQSAAGDQNGKGVGFWTVVGAGAGLALGLVATANNDECESPDSLCPLVLGGMTVFGAIAGLFIGL